ncbi:hypothetical protein FQN60_010948 [Etheostoma spectabile]|uniref:Uncharacterized protein n=1 Tax=Etheostoma spectabile TaxID=54343 RepID=A0A5J5DQC9_9PERO|nr:hypothetical protein FQN60_010948 [Etheostoma spectabile]
MAGVLLRESFGVTFHPDKPVPVEVADWEAVDINILTFFHYVCYTNPEILGSWSTPLCIVSQVGQYLFATPASPSVNSPPATTSQAGTSHHLLLQLHLNEEARKTAFLVRDGRLELKWSKEKQRTRRTGRARRAMSEASGSYTVITEDRAFKPRDERGFWRIIKSSLTYHQIQEIQATATKNN